MISNNISTCQDCGGKLKYYDKVRRIVRTKGRVSKWVNVPRYQCSECGCIHRYLPDYIYPYKQYESEILNRNLHKHAVGFDKDSGNRLTLNIAWRISQGKKRQAAEKTINLNDSDNGIMK